MKKTNLFLKIFFLFFVISMSQAAKSDPVYIKLTGTNFSSTGNGDGPKAFDGDITTYVDANTASGRYVGTNLGVWTKVTKLRFYPRAGWASRMTGGTFQGSNDNVIWTTFYTISPQPSDGAWTEVLVDADYQWVRYMSPATGYCNVAEVEFWTTQGAVPTPISVQSVSIQNPTYTLKVAQTVQVNNTILPANATNKKFTYSIAPSGIASIDNVTGILTALTVGTGTITVTTEDGAKTATSALTVNAATELKLTGTQFDNFGNGGAAFDGNINSWCDTSTPSASTGLNFGSEKSISKIRFYPRSGIPSRMTNGIFQGSNDNITYTNIYTITSQPTDNAWTEVLVTASYQYVRYQTPDMGFLNVAEIEFWTPVIPTFTTVATGSANWSSLAAWTGNVVPSDGASIIILNNLTIDQNVSVSSLTINPGAKLTLNTGKTLTAASFNINSDATNGTGTFVDNGTTSIGGTINVKQYLLAGRNWYLSSPVSGAKSNAFSVTASNPVYYYNESACTWPTITNNSTSLGVMQGYVANVATTGNVTFTGGTLNTGAQTITNLSATGASKTGFNLVGNPYPSFLDWDAAVKTNLSSTIWYRSMSTGSYLFQTYNKAAGIGANGASNLIPSMQSFWVLVNTGQSGSLTVNNSMRSHQDQSIASNRLKAPSVTKTSQQVLRLQVSNGINSDEAILLFNPNASNNLDEYDSQKMTNDNTAIPEIYTVVGSKQLVINSLNRITTNEEIPLGFTPGVTNFFTIKANEVSNFDAGTQIILKDNQTNSEQDITDGSAYDFSSDAATTATRFSIIFRTSNIVSDLNNKNTIDDEIRVYQNSNGLITVNCSKRIVDRGIVSVYNAVGQKLYNKVLTNTSTILDKTLKSGVYMISVVSNGKTITRRVVLN